MKIEFKGDVRRIDCQNGLLLHRRIRRWVKFAIPTVWVIVVLVSMSQLFLEIFAGSMEFGWSKICFLATAALAGAALVKRAFQRHRLNTPLWHLRGEFTDDGITIDQPIGGRKYGWSAFVAFNINSRIALLYYTPQKCWIITRQMVKNSEQWKALGDILERNIPPFNNKEAQELQIRICEECLYMREPAEIIKLGDRYVCEDCKPVAAQKLKEGV